MAEQDVVTTIAAKTVREKSNAGHIKANDLRVVAAQNPTQELGHQKHGHQTDEAEAPAILAEYGDTLANFCQPETLVSQDALEKCLNTLHALRLERDYASQNSADKSNYSDEQHGVFKTLMVMHKELTQHCREDESTTGFWSEEESLRENANLALEDILTALSAQNGSACSGMESSSQPDLTPDRD